MSFKTFLYGSPREVILQDIENFGKSLIELAKEGNYSIGEKNKAKHHAQNLEATRKAYKRIKDGEDMFKVISELWYYVKDDKLKVIMEKSRRN
jgi:hypothetical protein